VNGTPRRRRFALRGRIARFLLSLVEVRPVDVGKPNDGLVPSGLVERTAGGPFDPTFGDLQASLADALEARRKNPLARRIVNLVNAYVCGDGLTLSASYGPLKRYIQAFVNDPLNLIYLEQYGWCEDLTTTGELFLSLHFNVASGISYVRPLPASVIDAITYRPGDYRQELSYHEAVPVSDPDYAQGGRTWLSPLHPDADTPAGDGGLPPVVLHFAVNRPIGCLRGESDLATVLPWLKRYARWLEDRVRLNAALRAFLWQLSVPPGMVDVKKEQYRNPPEPGAVVVVEKDREAWEAVVPDLKAADAKEDGRAIRWMIAAGGPNIGLADLGEAEGSNLATAEAMGEQRLRFMRARQQYFAYVLAWTALTAYNRAVRLGRVRGRERTLTDIAVITPDIAPSDNNELGQAAQALAGALATVQSAGFEGPTWKRLLVQLVLKFAGESLEDADLETLLAESEGAGAEQPAQGQPAEEEPAPDDGEPEEGDDGE
jgi:hypothetical protein